MENTFLSYGKVDFWSRFKKNPFKNAKKDIQRSNPLKDGMFVYKTNDTKFSHSPWPKKEFTMHNFKIENYRVVNFSRLKIPIPIHHNRNHVSELPHCVSVCVCVHIYIYTHTHTYTTYMQHIYYICLSKIYDICVYILYNNFCLEHLLQMHGDIFKI